MHVDIHRARIEREEQREQRLAPFRDQIAIRCAHGTEQKLVTHRPAVDEQELQCGVVAMQRREGCEASQRQAFLGALDAQGVVYELASHDAAEAREMAFGCRAGPRQGEWRAFAGGQLEADLGMRHGQPLDDLADGHRLGALGFEEFQPRRRRREQLAHLYNRAVIECCRTDLALGAAIDGQ